MLCPTNKHIGIPFCSLLIKSEYLGFVLVFYLIKWYLIKIIVRKQTKGIVQISKSMKEFSDKTKVNREGKKGVPVLTTTIVISIIKRNDLQALHQDRWGSNKEHLEALAETRKSLQLCYQIKGKTELQFSQDCKYFPLPTPCTLWLILNSPLFSCFSKDVCTQNISFIHANVSITNR